MRREKYITSNCIPQLYRCYMPIWNGRKKRELVVAIPAKGWNRVLIHHWWDFRVMQVIWRQLTVFTKLILILLGDPASQHPGTNDPRGLFINLSPHTNFHRNDYGGLLHSCQRMKRRMSISGWMDRRTVAHACRVSISRWIYRQTVAHAYRVSISGWMHRQTVPNM